MTSPRLSPVPKAASCPCDVCAKTVRAGNLWMLATSRPSRTSNADYIRADYGHRKCMEKKASENEVLP
jgi:hypothetical protein